jgi:hypothetical protein
MGALAFCLLVIIASGLVPVAAQDSPPAEGRVSGHVLDAITGEPIRAARVALTVANIKDGVRMPSASQSPDYHAESDATGAYTLPVASAGSFEIKVEVEGYAPAASRPLTITSSEKSQTKDFKLYRFAALGGRLVDERTKRPVSGLVVNAARVIFNRGVRLLIPTEPATTTANGEFRIEGLLPGEYFLDLAAAIEAVRPLREPDYSSKAPRPKGYRRSLWPDTGDAGVGLTVRSGDEMRLGDIALSEQPLFRIRGALPAACTKADRFALGISQQYGSAHFIRAKSELPCGSRFTFVNLSPGTYQVDGWVKGKKLPERTYAFAEATIETDDLDVTLSPVHALVVNAQVSFPQSIREEDRSGIRVSLDPVRGLAFAEEVGTAAAGEDGKCTLRLFSRAEVDIEITGINAPNYVKEIFYNGSRIAGTIFRPAPYAIEHTLRIVVADDSATLRGSVSTSDVPEPNAGIVIVPWPTDPAASFPTYYPAQADPMGQFTKAGLPPGTYHVVAYTESGARKLQMPDVLRSLASDGKEVQLPAKGAVSVAMEPSRF